MNYRYLLANLVNRDIKVKYRRSTLGMLWSVLNPLLMMSVMVLVFGTLYRNMGLNQNLPLVASTGQPPTFAVYVLTGQLIFTFFSDSTSMAMDSVLGNAQLIKKVYIPKYIFPMEKVLFGLINTLLSFVSLALVILVTRSPVSPWIFLVPIHMLLLFAFNLGVGLILSCVVVFFRDIKHLYSVLILALTYMTPIFYSESIWDNYSFISYLSKCNPMYWYVQGFRDLVIYGQPPDGRTLFATVGCAAVALLLGLAVFRKKQDDFILYL